MDEVGSLLKEQLEIAVKTARENVREPQEMAELTMAVARLAEVILGYRQDSRSMNGLRR